MQFYDDNEEGLSKSEIEMPEKKSKKDDYERIGNTAINAEESALHDHTEHGDECNHGPVDGV